jgi:hypothetical protein
MNRNLALCLAGMLAASAVMTGTVRPARAQGDDPVPPRRRPTAKKPDVKRADGTRADAGVGEPMDDPALTGIRPVRLAILDFYERTPYGDKPGSLGRTVASLLAAEYLKRGRFRMVGREAIDEAMSRAKLPPGALIGDAAALRVGRLTRADYVIFGDIGKFTVERSGKDNNLAKVTIDYKMVAVEMGRIWRTRTLSASSIGDSKADPKDVTETALQRTAGDFAKLTIPEPTGKVAALDLDKNRFIINLGSSNGVEKGALYQVVRLGQPIKDPDTGETIERQRDVVGFGRVEEVSERTARLVAGEYRKSDLGQVKWRTRTEILEAIRVGDVVEALESRKLGDER